MTYRKNAEIAADFNSTTLQISLRASLKPKYNSWLDFAIVADLGKEITRHKNLQDEKFRKKLFDTTATLVKYYPPKMIVPNEDFKVLCDLNPEINRLVARYPKKFQTNELYKAVI